MADWAAIKSEYVTSEISQRAIAKKYGVSNGSVSKHAKAEGWDKERETHKETLVNTTKHKVIEKISDMESDIAALKAESRRLLWEVTRDRIKGITEETEAADVRRYVQNYTDMLNSEPQGAQNNAGMSEQIDAARASWREFIEGKDNGTE